MTGNVLVSYHYFKAVDLDRLFAERPPRAVFADSGAFSALTQGAAIDLGDYSEWLGKWSHLFDVTCNLDVIYDEHTSQTNLDRLEADGHHPLPVFHAGSPFRVLEDMADRYDYICLGGIARHGSKRKALQRWFDACFNIVEGRARLHGLGVTGWWALTRYPWRSVDSTSWGAGHRYGLVRMFDPAHPNRGVFSITFGTDDITKHARLIRSYGVDPTLFLDREAYHRGDAIKLGARVWDAVQTYLSGLDVYLGITDAAEAKGTTGCDVPNPGVYLGHTSTDSVSLYLGGADGPDVSTMLDAHRPPQMFLGDGAPENINLLLQSTDPEGSP